MQDTNLKVSPYFDDFDRSKNYQKILFKPGYSVQTRELNTLQSTLQNQIERFGQHIFKDGSVVIPGNIGYNLNYDSVLVQNLINGISVETYRNSLVGKTITGLSSGVKAVVLDTLSQEQSEKNVITLYIKYTSSGFFENDVQFSRFKNNEVIVDDVTKEPLAITTIQNSTSYSGSVAYISPGVYFIRGFFVEVPAQRVILDQYSNTPSYKIGLVVNENVITANDDESLFDNALGSTNYAAPGADRLQITATLTKQSLLVTNDSNFIELLRLENGNLVKLVEYSAYNELEKNLARRTFDESGNYTLSPYTVKIREALFDGQNDGVYNVNQVLPDGRRILDRDPTPEETDAFNGKNYYALEVSEGKSYVKGFEVNNVIKQYVVAEKPRKSSQLNNQGIFLNIGSYLKLDNDQSLYGNVSFNDSLVLKDADGTVIGQASALGLAFGYYLYVADLTIYTKITLSTSSHSLSIGDFVFGNLSGASAIVHSVNSSTITLRQVSGTFLTSETISSSRVDYSTGPSITAVENLKLENVRQVEKLNGTTVVFSAYIKLESSILSGSSFTVSGTTLTGIGTNFASEVTAKSKLLIGSTSVEVNSLTSSSVTLESSPSVSSGTYYNVSKLVCKLYSSSSGLTTRISSSPVKQTSDLSYDVLVSETKTVSNGTFTISKLNNEYPDASTLIVTSSTGILTPTIVQTDSNTITVTNISNSITSVNVYYKVRVSNANYRKKEKISYQKLLINLTKNSTNTKYGTRIGDKEWSLKFPDVYKIHSIHEALNSTDSNDDMFDTLKLNNYDDVSVGDIISSGGIKAKVIHVYSTSLKVIYLSESKFPRGTNLAISVNIPGVVGRYVTESSYGLYNDITSNYQLVKNDSEEFYRVSKLVRKLNKPAPRNKVIVVFDYLKHDDLNSDFYTIDSYENIDYTEIPNSFDGNSYADIIDFRYYVTPSTSGSGTLTSPHYETNSSLDYSQNQIQSTSKFAYPQKLLSLDSEFYLGRIDKVYLNETGYVTVLKGSDSLTPKPPVESSTSLLLATVTLPAYLKRTTDVRIILENTKGYTMKDIGKLEERLFNVETYTSLNLLEVNTNNLNILDEEGRNRFKNGFVVDKFNTTTVADLLNPDYSASVDTNNALLRPYPYVNNIAFNYNESESGTRKTTDIITLPYTEVAYASQPFGSRVENLQPYEIIDWSGNVSLNPAKDVWYDTVRTIREGQTIDLEGPIRFLFDRSGAAGDQWGEWQTIGRERVAGGTNILQERTGVNNSLIATQQTIETGDTINSINDIKYARSMVVDLKGTSLKPNTRFNLTINDIEANQYFYPKLLTGITGVNRKFVVGETVTISPIYDDNEIRPQVVEGITAKVVNPYQWTTNTSIIENNFIVSSTTGNFEYSQTTSILAIDSVSGLEELSENNVVTSNILNPGQIGSKFRIVGQSSGAVGICEVQPRVISNEIGEVHAFVIVPPETIETGIIRYLITDNEGNNSIIGIYESSATTNFLSQGAQVNVTSSIVSVSVPEVVTNPIREPNTIFIADPPPNRGGIDPIAQSFFVDTEGGVFLTSIDLYFYTKDDTAPVRVDIRTMENGYPTQIIVPYSTVTVPSSEINISTDASIPTRFTFPSPVYLSSQTDYCFVVFSPSLNYYIWVSRLGEFDVTTNYSIDKQPYVGILFKSSNMSTWTPDQYEDIKFTLNRAKFDTNVTKTANLYNKPITKVRLQSNPLVFTEDLSVIRILQPNHGMHSNQNYVSLSNVVSDVPNGKLASVVTTTSPTITVNDVSGFSFDFSSVNTWSKVNNQNISQSNLGYIKIDDEIISYSGISSNNVFTVYERGALNTTVAQHNTNAIVQCYMINGIPLNEINTTHSVHNVINLDEYEIITTKKSNSTLYSGGSKVKCSRNIQYESVTPKINILNLPNTDSNLVLKSYTGTSIGSNQTSFASVADESLENNEENDLTSPRLVASVINENNYFDGPGRSMKVSVNMSTTVDTLSPVIDLAGSSIITVSNRINKEVDSNGDLDISSELLPTGGLHSSYITKKVILENSSTSIRVLFEAIRRQGVDIKVFAKVRSDSMLSSFSDCNYIEIPAESYPVSQTETEYRSFEYELKGLQEFKEWSIKVVMIGNDQSNVPKIRNFRAIALAI